MPYRRNEWQDRIRQRTADLIRLIYRQRIRREQVEGSKPEKPETEESQSYASFYIPYVYSAPKPESSDDVDSTDDADSSDVADSTDDTESTTQKPSKPDKPPGRPQPTSVPDEILDYEREQEYRLGISNAAQKSGQSTSDSASDIATKSDTSQAEVVDICDRLCEQTPEVMTAVMNIIEGADTDDDEQTLQDRVNNHLRIMGLNDAFGQGDWFTTRLDPIVESTATRIVDHYFDRVEATNAALTAAQAALTTEQSLVETEIGGFEQPEINLLTQYYLSETYPDWNSSWTEKEDLENFLKGKLKALIHGIDVDSVSWGALSVQELVNFYRSQMAEQTAALWKRYQDVSNEYYQEMQAEFDRATGLVSMAQAIPLDDTEAYAAAFAGIVQVPDAESERRHVLDQLERIYKHILGEDSDHLATLSTTELKYELFFRLNYDVLPFLRRDEHEIQMRISTFMTDFVSAARDTPEGVIDRLQGTFRQPDVLGFLFIMSISIAFEPVDWALTTVDIIQALSEDDIESAIGNAILGATPFVSSQLDDLVQPFFKRLGDTPKYFANPVGKGNVTPSSESLQRLMSEHDELSAAVAEDAIRGAERVKGVDVSGADILLPGGVEREVTVHTGKQANFGSHLVRKARQFSENATRKEIYIQIKPREGVVINKRSLLNEITDKQEGW